MYNTLSRTTKAACLGLALIAGTVATGAAADHHRSPDRMSDKTPAKDIVDTAAGAGQFETLVAAVKAAGLVDALKSEGPFTVFAPNDPAFKKLGSSTLNSLLEPEAKGRLTDILTYHVVPGKITAADLATRTSLTTVNGQRLEIRSDKGLRINDSGFVATDIKTSNGIIHVVDAVLVPTDKTIADIATEAGSFKTLLAAAEAAGLTGALGGENDLTVFAPTDDAFAKLGRDTISQLLRPENKATLKSILAYHVVSGRVYASDLLVSGSLETLNGEPISPEFTDRGISLQQASVAKADIQANNGVVHVIDAVLMPPSLANAGSRSDATGKADMSPATEVVVIAINEGAPLYNHGNKQACAAVYMVAAKSLLANEDMAMSEATRRDIASAVRSAEHTHDAGERAWIMRRAFDRMLDTEPRMASSGH